MDSKYIRQIRELGFQWETNNPFLFCVHHLDSYPRGNEEMGPAASLEGRNIGQDFTPKGRLEDVPRKQSTRIPHAPASRI